MSSPSSVVELIYLARRSIGLAVGGVRDYHRATLAGVCVRGYHKAGYHKAAHLCQFQFESWSEVWLGPSETVEVCNVGRKKSITEGTHRWITTGGYTQGVHTDGSPQGGTHRIPQRGYTDQHRGHTQITTGGNHLILL